MNTDETRKESRRIIYVYYIYFSSISLLTIDFLMDTANDERGMLFGNSVSNARRAARVQRRFALINRLIRLAAERLSNHPIRDLSSEASISPFLAPPVRRYLFPDNDLGALISKFSV